MSDHEDTNGQRVADLASHQEKLADRRARLLTDLREQTEFVAYLIQLQQAWTDFHQSAAIIRNYYMDEDNESALDEFMMKAIKGSSKRLTDLASEISVQHDAISMIRMELRAIREDSRFQHHDAK